MHTKTHAYTNAHRDTHTQVYSNRDTRTITRKHACINSNTRVKHTRTRRTYSHTHSRTHARERAYTHTHTHTQTHTHRDTHTDTHTHTHKNTHKHSYTIIFIYRTKCLTFYSLNISKTYTNCVCEFKKPKVFLKIIIQNVTFKTQSSNF